MVLLLTWCPIAGFAASAGCSAAAMIAALIGFALQKPAKRAAFRTRRSGSIVAAVAEFAAGAAIGFASGSAVAWPPLLTVPVVAAGVAGWLLWRTEAPPRRS
jgi:ABC-2 type transport system permease protein